MYSAYLGTTGSVAKQMVNKVNDLNQNTRDLLQKVEKLKSLPIDYDYVTLRLRLKNERTTLSNVKEKLDTELNEKTLLFKANQLDDMRGTLDRTQKVLDLITKVFDDDNRF